MQMTIAGFVLGLMIIANVYAESGAVSAQVVSSSVDNTAAFASPEVAAPVSEASKANIPVSANAPTYMETTSKATVPQAEYTTTAGQEQGLTGPQVNIDAAGLSSGTIDSKFESLSRRLAELEAQNSGLQNLTAQMNERIRLLEKPQECFAGKLLQRIDTLKNQLGPKLFLITISSVGVIFLLLLVYIIFPWRRNPGAVSYPQNDLPTGSHEDFNPMEGQDGNVAKLNLARAYIEMGNESKAQGILYEVLAHGSDAEQTEATGLLEKIKHPMLDR